MSTIFDVKVTVNHQYQWTAGRLWQRWKPDRKRLLNILKAKCEFKDINIPTMDNINAMPNKKDLHADWQDMLAHQIAALEPCEHYWSQLPAFFHWLYT